VAPSPTDAGTPGLGRVGSDSVPTVPRQLPADVPGFAGRAEHLARLDKLLANTGGQPAAVVISAVSGTAGVGRTALAVRWAHRVADRFPDGQLYVNLRGFDPGRRVMGPADAIRGFLDASAWPASAYRPPWTPRPACTENTVHHVGPAAPSRDDTGEPPVTRGGRQIVSVLPIPAVPVIAETTTRPWCSLHPREASRRGL
jgi:hypothetical protein